MDPIKIPAEAIIGRPTCKTATLGPPPGVSPADVGTVEMLIDPALDPRGIGHAMFAYFRPGPAELEALVAGGFLEMAQWGNGVQPFGLAVWSIDPDEPDGDTPATGAAAALAELRRDEPATFELDVDDACRVFVDAVASELGSVYGPETGIAQPPFDDMPEKDRAVTRHAVLALLEWARDKAREAGGA